MNITVELTNDSIDKAIARLERYRSDVIEFGRKLIAELSEVGKAVLIEKYDNAAYTDNNDIEIAVEIGDDEIEVIAYGYVVAFIEFGTGIHYPESSHGARLRIPPRGSFGLGQGGTGKPWTYPGNPGRGNIGWRIKDDKGNITPGVSRTRGTPAAEAFPAAVSKMMNEYIDIIHRLIKEFDSD